LRISRLSCQLKRERWLRVAHLQLAEPRQNDSGGTVALRYVARAGLIRELSAQTYDTFWKALREAILNSIDADASRIDVSLPGDNDTTELVVNDNGSGMDVRALSEHFLSVGGSARVGDATKFGRIGIGSLALLQYGAAVTIETKLAGSESYCVAELLHDDWIKEASRRDLLGDVLAGTAREIPYDGMREDHFTRIRLHDPSLVVREAGSDPMVRVELADRLRRVLPLTWPTNRLTVALEETDPSIARELADHAALRSAEVVLHSSWDEGIRLVRRQFGERTGVGEDWTGPLFPIRKELRVETPSGSSRTIIVAGYLLNQAHASAAWSGVTARVQNVAIEENTFFDVVADPGFRKYISGEIYFLGDVDRERLINIDRASFNRESPDYLVAQRYIADTMQRFKVRHVQQPQRLKVSARRLVQEHSARLAAMQRVIEMDRLDTSVLGTGLPSSGKRFKSFAVRSLEEILEGIGCRVAECDAGDPTVTVDESGTVVCGLPPGWTSPTLEVRGKRYEVVFGEARDRDLPVIIRNRPRQIMFNLDHPAHCGKSPEALARTLALEIAYLQSIEGSPEDLFERFLTFLTIT
jgi:hypothetical protein